MVQSEIRLSQKPDRQRTSRTKFSPWVFFILCLFSAGSPRAQDKERQLTQPAPTSQSKSQHRIALVVGNGAYEHAGRLANPPNDATLVAATLRRLGFEVSSGSNLTQREMKQRIREFGQTLRSNGGVGLFYFAGHGVQAKGHNYLVPVDADIQTEADLEDVAVDLNYVLSLMDDAQNALNIVVLDACRNNPFARSFRSAQGGLAQVKAPTGTLIAYATAPDSIASDGTGTNSPYSQELVKEMQASGVLVETMFRRVTEQVSARTNGKQEPWFSANVKGDFYFNGTRTDGQTTSAENSTVGAGNSKLDPAAIELSYWESIKNSSDPADYEDYLRKYPNGQFSDLARRRATRSSEQREGKSTSQSEPLSSGVLNGKAISLPPPSYPPIARAVRASGQVEVKVTIDEQGNVISAQAISGHSLLQAAAVAAAYQAKFKPILVSGTPVKVTGIIIYNFSADDKK